MDLIVSALIINYYPSIITMLKGAKTGVTGFPWCDVWTYGDPYASCIFLMEEQVDSYKKN